MNDPHNTTPPPSESPTGLNDNLRDWMPFMVLLSTLGIAFLVGLNLYGQLQGPAEGTNTVTTRLVEVTRVVALEPTLAPSPTAIPAENTIDDDPYMGSASAVVKVVEFSDFQCSFCGRFYVNTLEPLTARYGDLIQFVYRDYPIFGEPSFQSAMAAECAADQGEFWPYHSLIFDNLQQQTPLPLEYGTFLTWAQQLELDTDQWANCMNDPATRQEIELDLASGRTWGITGTPTFFINGQILVGAHPIETFIQLIDQELVAQGIEPPTGTGG